MTATMRAYECGLKGYEHTSVIHQISAAKAKYEYFRHICDVWNPASEGEIFKRLTCRSLSASAAHASLAERRERLAYTAERRGVPFVQIGMAVECDGQKGQIVGGNDSGNFDVLFTEGTAKGHVGNCHPHWRMKYFATDGTLTFDSERAS